MHRALSQFRQNLALARDLLHLHDALGAQTASALDLTDLLRAHIVLSVSALDHYVHELVRLGMLATLAGTRPATASYDVFPVRVQDAAASSTGGTAWLEEAVRRHHASRSFQQPEKIADAISLVSGVTLWKAVAAKMSMPADDVRNTLKAVVNRRNKIAHEADADPSYPGTRWPITPQDAAGASAFLERLVQAIHDSVA